jgi:hypothetical protein
VSQQTTNRSFDDLARAVAEGSLSRRGALKLFAGTALAALIPSRALADDCVRICHVPFNRDTDECDFANAVTRCVSRRERRRHLENHPCDCRGRCANCLTTCPTGGSCQTEFPSCSPSPDVNCFCIATTEGTTFCAQSISCADPDPTPCTSSQDCPSGWVCFDTCCLGEGSICNPPCGTIVGGAASPADNQGMSGH